MEGYSEDMLAKEVAVAKAAAAGDRDLQIELGRELAAMGSVDCAVCGMVIRFHFLDGWVHQDEGIDHDARPNRIGMEWPPGIPQLGGRAAH